MLFDMCQVDVEQKNDILLYLGTSTPTNNGEWFRAKFNNMFYKARANYRRLIEI